MSIIQNRTANYWELTESMSWPVRIRMFLRWIFPKPSTIIRCYNPKARWLWPLYYFLCWYGILQDFWEILRDPLQGAEEISFSNENSQIS